MAIVSFGVTVVGIRGTVGGATFSANKAGPYVRAWSRPTNPRSIAQQVSRGAMTQCGPAWQNATGAERAGWDALAVTDPEPHFNSLGDPVTLSGWGYFLMCNKRRLRNGQAISAAFPTGTEATRPASVTPSTFAAVAGTPAALTATWATGGIAATDYAVLKVNVIPSPVSAFIPNRLYWIGTVLGTVGSFDLGASFSAQFGEVQAGWTVAGQFYIQRASGLRSVGAAVSAVIT